MNNLRFIRLITQKSGQKIAETIGVFCKFLNYSYFKAIVSNPKSFRQVYYASDYLLVIGKNNFDDFLPFEAA